MNKDYVECLECGMPERKEWADAGKHECNIITDKDYKVVKDINIRIGKSRFVKIKVV